jgi:hypothetical protein
MIGLGNRCPGLTTRCEISEGRGSLGVAGVRTESQALEMLVPKQGMHTCRPNNLDLRFKIPSFKKSQKMLLILRYPHIYHCRA